MLALSPSEVHVFRSHREEPEKSPSTFLLVHRQFVGLPFPKKGIRAGPLFVSGSSVLPSAGCRRVLRSSSLSGRILSSPVWSQSEETKLRNFYLKQEQALEVLASGHSPR